MAAASLIFWLMRASLARSHTWKASASGRLFCCRTRRRSSAAAADLLLDRIECGDVLQRLACDRRGAGCREFVEVAPHVHPAEGELDLATFGKLGVGVVAIDLQDALEAGKMAEQPLGLAVRCIDIGDAGRIEAAP